MRLRIPLLSRSTIYLLLYCSVLLTTVFSGFNLNSYCILLLVAYRIWDAPETARSVFSDKLFLAYLVYCLIETAGLLRTHNLKVNADAVAKDATLVAIAFVLCTGTLAAERTYAQLMETYCGMIFLASVYCLVTAFRQYLQRHDPTVFLYHPLTAPISQNAVFFSVYVIFAILFLLYAGKPALMAWPGSSWNNLRFLLVLFFLFMIVLLSSKLLLIITLLMLAGFFFRKFSFQRNWLSLAFGASVVLISLIFVFATDNPIGRRFTDLTKGDLKMVREQQLFPPGTDFNGLQLRVLEWRFAVEILNRQHAWLFGVSPGDSQDLLDAKYVAANMYIGNPADGPHRKIRGFIGYNFHNQYIETLVKDGILGLLALLAIFAGLAAKVWRQPTKTAFFTVLTLFIFFIPQAPLTMQHGIFLFCFFPLSAVYLQKDRE